jgi:hypothetical protein
MMNYSGAASGATLRSATEASQTDLKSDLVAFTPTRHVAGDGTFLVNSITEFVIHHSYFIIIRHVLQ